MPDHDHLFVLHARFDDAPCPEGRHTAFQLLRCACGAIEIFPRQNFALTTPRFQADLRVAIETSGFRLVTSP